jgi:hypothetical protein
MDAQQSLRPQPDREKLFISIANDDPITFSSRLRPFNALVLLDAFEAYPQPERRANRLNITDAQMLISIKTA